MSTYKIVIQLETDFRHEPRSLEQALLMALGPKGIFPIVGTMRVTEIVETQPAPSTGATGQSRY